MLEHASVLDFYHQNPGWIYLGDILNLSILCGLGMVSLRDPFQRLDMWPLRIKLGHDLNHLVDALSHYFWAYLEIPAKLRCSFHLQLESL